MRKKFGQVNIKTKFFYDFACKQQKELCYSIVIARTLAFYFISFRSVCFHFMRIPSADTKAKSKRSWPLQYSSCYLWASFLPIHSCECTFFCFHFSPCDIHSQFLISPYNCASLKEFKETEQQKEVRCNFDCIYCIRLWCCLNSCEICHLKVLNAFIIYVHIVCST